MYIMYFLISNRDVYDIQHPCYLGNGMYNSIYICCMCYIYTCHTHMKISHIYEKCCMYLASMGSTPTTIKGDNLVCLNLDHLHDYILTHYRSGAQYSHYLHDLWGNTYHYQRA